MVESGLEAGINHNRSEKRCPKCQSTRIHKIETKYTTSWMCDNEACSQILFQRPKYN